MLCGAIALACTLSAPRAAADGAPDPEDVARIARLLEPARSVAVAQELVERGAAAVPALAAALKDPKLRAPVLDVITRIGPDATDAVPAVSAIVRLQRNPARPAAARALGAIGADAAPAMNNLVVYVNDERATGREEAVAAMGRILVSQAARLRKPAPPSAVDAALAAGADWLLRHQSEDGRWSCRMHGSWVMRAMSGKEYVAWRTALVGALVPSQRVAPGADACAVGSWDAIDPWSPEGGRVYATAMAMLSLEYCSEDPAARPPLPSTSIGALAALEAAAGTDASEPVRTAARRALEGVRNAYR